MGHQFGNHPAQLAGHPVEHVLPVDRIEVGRERGQLVQALGVADPGRPAVGEQEVCAVGQLEVGSRRRSWLIWPNRQPGQQDAERLDELAEFAAGLGPAEGLDVLETVSAQLNLIGSELMSHVEAV